MKQWPSGKFSASTTTHSPIVFGWYGTKLDFGQLNSSIVSPTAFILRQNSWIFALYNLNMYAALSKTLIVVLDNSSESPIFSYSAFVSTSNVALDNFLIWKFSSFRNHYSLKADSFLFFYFFFFHKTTFHFIQKLLTNCRYFRKFCTKLSLSFENTLRFSKIKSSISIFLSFNFLFQRKKRYKRRFVGFFFAGLNLQRS